MGTTASGQADNGVNAEPMEVEDKDIGEPDGTAGIGGKAGNVEVTGVDCFTAANGPCAENEDEGVGGREGGRD